MEPISEQLAQLRQDYQMNALNEQDLEGNPVVFFQRWFDEARASELPEPNAMSLATVDASGQPQVRIVLLKGIEKEKFVFFTNYLSQKGQALEHNPKAGLMFFWHGLERQVRIEGVVEKTSEAYSNEYFNIRPLESRISAIVSPQSMVIQSREWLESNVVQYHQNLKGNIPLRPNHWGGYALVPHKIEFWQGRKNRLHDRILYTFDERLQIWNINRLAP